MAWCPFSIPKLGNVYSWNMQWGDKLWRAAAFWASLDKVGKQALVDGANSNMLCVLAHVWQGV